MRCALFFVSLAISSLAAPSRDEQESTQEFCRHFPSLHLCRLHGTLQGSLVELQYLLQGANPDNDPNSDNTDQVNQMEKRKSAFVRFGKRSLEDASMLEKRKSAFVRFGRAVPDDIPEKRKSQYVRFGRK